MKRETEKSNTEMLAPKWFLIVILVGIYYIFFFGSIILTTQFIPALISLCVTGTTIWFSRKDKRKNKQPNEWIIYKALIVGIIFLAAFLFIRYDLNNKLVVYDFNENKFINKGYVALVTPSQSVVRIEKIKHTSVVYETHNRLYFEQGNLTWSIIYTKKVDFNTPNQFLKYIVPILKNKSWTTLRSFSFGKNEVHSMLKEILDVHGYDYVKLINTTPKDRLKQDLENLLAEDLTLRLKKDGINADVDIIVISISSSVYFD